MIRLTPPIQYGRRQRFGITTKITINGKWENVEKVISQSFSNNTGRLQEQYTKWGLDGHNGTDIVLYTGDNILAAHSGVCITDTIDSSGGIGLDIWNEEGKFKTRYWHNMSNIAKKGDIIQRGQVIALGDTTGFSTGSHLHFNVKLTDDKGNTINKGNGYYGAIDDRPFRVDMGVLTEQDVKKLYHLTFNRDADESGLEHYTGKSLTDFYTEVMQSEEKIHYKAVNESIKRLEDWARN